MPRCKVAIDAAPLGAVVRIGPGTCRGPVLINKPLILEGAGADATSITNEWVTFHELLIDGKGVPVVLQERFEELRTIAVDQEYGEGPVTTQILERFGPKTTLTIKDVTDVVVRGLSISMPGTVRKGGWQTSPMTLLDNASATLDQCAVVGSTVDGVRIQGTLTVKMRHCLIGGIRSTGIVIRPAEDASVRIEDCDVRGCGYSGITISGAGDVTVSSCRISQTEFHGVRYSDSAPKISGNVFSDINREAISTKGKTNGVISDNLFLDCRIGGSEDQIVNNTFVHRGNHRSANKVNTAIFTSGTGSQRIRRNVISGYDLALILVSTDKKPVNQDVKRFEQNLCDTKKPPVVNSHKIEPKSSYATHQRPDYRDLPLPVGNWQMTAKFNNIQQGDYSLSPTVDWPDGKLGASEHASPASPWPDQPAERNMLSRIREVEK